MKKYIKSLFPWRWVWILIFILCVSVFIATGFAVDCPDGQIDYFKYPWLWYSGNVIYWFLVDIFLGINRIGWISRKLDNLN